MRLEAQLIRSNNLLRDGRGVWYDARKEPSDYDSFTRLDKLPESVEKESLYVEKAALEEILPQFDLYGVDSEAPLPPADVDGDGLSDAFERRYSDSLTIMKPDEDPDEDGVDNYYEFVFNTDPLDPAFPTDEQKPHLTTVSDAQGEYLALRFQRSRALGYDYWCKVEGSSDGDVWKTDGVVQQLSTERVSPELEMVTACVAAPIEKSNIKQLRLTVHKPIKRKPRKFESIF